MDEDKGHHEDLNEHEMSEEASDSYEGQQEFDESVTCCVTYPYLYLEIPGCEKGCSCSRH